MRILDRLTRMADRRWGWDGVRRWAGLVILIGLRNALRRSNLYDTGDEPAVGRPPLAPPDPRWERARSPDGSYNDLQRPRMGMAGARFGRNIPPASTLQEAPNGILEPSPRTVSRELMTRDPFQPATGVNSLVAAWLQFMIRDWFQHGRSSSEDPWRVPVPEGDPWEGPKPMPIMRTPADPTRPADSIGPATYVNELTHWWDGSSIYGRNAWEQEQVRGEDGRLRLEAGRPPVFDAPQLRDEPGFWLGLALMHTLFVREHNAICDALAAAHPDWDGERTFDVARLVNAALMAKIHMVEWTPAVLAHPTTTTAIRANWWGLLGERIRRSRGRVSKNEVLSGIPGSPTDHFGVPFSLTEEFVAVYRMHPMIRDDWSVRSLADDSSLAELDFPAIAGPAGLSVLDGNDSADLLYSFGTLNPGLVSLHNYPRTLQQFRREDGQLMDLAAIDVLRTRELGVPRYNEFRRLLRLKPAESFEELTDDPLWAGEIQRVYDDDVERVDLLVGMYAERRPAGLAFSDTALRIFMLMASRRLNSDRFFTDDYRPEIYTDEGMSWIEDNSLKTVLLRHHPELAPALRGRDNAFAPWERARP